MSSEDVDLEFASMGCLVDIEIGRRSKRPMCDNCNRPKEVCWCRSLSSEILNVKSRIICLQHPHEEKRCLRTAPMLEAGLPSGHYIEEKGKKFSIVRHPQLEEIFTSKNSIILYPGNDAVEVDKLPKVGPEQPPYNIIILDGTWQQAKSLYHKSKILHNLRQVCLGSNYSSKYTIRTQPSKDALSTVESAAIALATLEDCPDIYHTLVQPLVTLCKHQMDHGAVTHHSKEEMILSGRYNKSMGKRTYQKLKKCGVRNTSLTYNDIVKLSKKLNQMESNYELEEYNSENNTECIMKKHSELLERSNASSPCTEFSENNKYISDNQIS